MPTEPELPELHFEWSDGPSEEEALTREWLVTNGLGSYASGSIAWGPTRKYHGVFIPALPGEKGRAVLVARLCEEVEVGRRRQRLDVEEHADGTVEASALGHLRRFSLRGLVPEWEYEVFGVRLRRRLVFVHGENTLFVAYEHLSGPPARLHLRPFPNHRLHEHPVGVAPPAPRLTFGGARLQLQADEHAPPVKLRLYSPSPTPFVPSEVTSPTLEFRVERRRGYEWQEVQRSPGAFECELGPGKPLAIGFTTADESALERSPEEPFALERERELRLLEAAPPLARRGLGARLVLAADQFVIQPFVRPADEAWARATGQNARSVIAGYHWFTDWGRDTMISLEGLTLSTGRTREAAAILRTFQHYVRDGLLPNLFPEGMHDGIYNTADATLWFFHAIDRYLQATGDTGLLRELWPTLTDIVAHHLRGTRFHIGVDPADGLLRQGEEGYQLTWMDAKVDGWVVTPRRGKTVELNALWFNALRLMGAWAERLGEPGSEYLSHAERTQASFRARFWNPEEGCLFDLVDGETALPGGVDPAVRPNQVFAISLAHPVLPHDRWDAVLAKVEDELFTPFGLRTLSPRHPDFKATYDGDLRSRDAAYHQGTVWPWLLGHFVEAKLKQTGDAKAARRYLLGLEAHLREAGIGQISEIFDATAPFHPRGCIAQAWSVAETLRAYLRTG